MAFENDREICHNDLEKAVKQTTPIADTLAEKSNIEKLGKSLLAVVVIIPAIIWVLICSKEELKEELTKSLISYCNDLRKQTENSNKKLQEIFCSIKRELLQNCNA